jgi:hypothetical protein
MTDSENNFEEILHFALQYTHENRDIDLLDRAINVRQALQRADKCDVLVKALNSCFYWLDLAVERGEGNAVLDRHKARDALAAFKGEG